MFTYIDPSVRERLIEQGKLVRIDSRGQQISPTMSPEDPGLAVNVLGPIPLPIRRGELSSTVDWYAAVRHTELSRVDQLAAELRRQGGQNLFASLVSSIAVNSVLLIGNGREADNPLIRVHSSCLTGDVFGSQRCECGPQLESALALITAEASGGMVIYMAGHEGRGIGLWAKAATYLLQDAGESTYEANRSLGLPDDSRDFADAAALLHYFIGDRPFRLLTNNPKKTEDLNAMGLHHISPVRHVAGIGRFNRNYLSAKRDWGHLFEDSDLGDEN
jgi:GTP cyclohydrolase II